MELIPHPLLEQDSSDMVLPFIEANTQPISLGEISSNHIIPVFTKDNQTLISQHQFIEATYNELSGFTNDAIVGPFIRVSHPIKGRVPSARFKRNDELLINEETIYYERMMFVYLIPSITRMVNGQELRLVVGGVKAYNKDNLNKKGSTPQQFTFFIGFQVRVCSNLCVWSDGINTTFKVDTIDTLAFSIRSVLQAYNPENQISQLESLQNHYLNEVQFAHLLGKCRMYQHLKQDSKRLLVPPGVSDTHLSHVARHYYDDADFAANNGNIDLWSLYNLFTGALKSSYIDNIVDHNVNAGRFVQHLSTSMSRGSESWYLPQ